MSFQEKNFAVTLVNFSLILLYYSIRLWFMIADNTFTLENLSWLWVTIIICSVVVTILATILTHIVSAIVEAIKTKKEPVMKDIADERDKMIDLKGTKVTYTISSLGTFAAMLTFVFGQPALVMFSLLIFFGLLAQVAGDFSRLYFYRRGF
jgi:hypothetical protein